MSFRKVSPGTRFKQSPAYTAAWQNAVTDATKYYQEQIQLGKGGDSQPGVSRPPKIRNTTESDLLRGHAVQLGDYLLDPLDHRCLWFEGELYNGGTLAVVREATPNGKIGGVQLVGETTVIVNVTDTNHTHAAPVTSQVQFESANSGPVLLLQQPESTGVQELPGLLGDTSTIPDELRGEVASYVPAATSGNTYGLIVLKTSPAPLPLPTGTPALSGTIIVADVHGLGSSAFSAGDKLRAIKHVGVDSLGVAQVDWEHLPTAATPAVARKLIVDKGDSSQDEGDPVTSALAPIYSGKLNSTGDVWLQVCDDFAPDRQWLPALAEVIGIENGTYDALGDERPLYLIMPLERGDMLGFVSAAFTAADLSDLTAPVFGTGKVTTWMKENDGDIVQDDEYDCINILEETIAAGTICKVSRCEFGLVVEPTCKVASGYSEE